jgi:NADH-quinone oxidoreductase subunit N
VFVEARTVALLWPEVLLILAATAIFIGGAFKRSRGWWTIASLVAYVAAGVVLWSGGAPWSLDSVNSGPVTVDSLSFMLRSVSLIAGFTLTLTVSRLADKELASEFLGSLMLAVAGAMITSVANELVLLFMGLELISIPTYVLLFLGRRDQASAEATMKYFFLSIFSSAMLLYGFSFLYGMGGTTLIAGNEQLPGLREKITQVMQSTDAPPINPNSVGENGSSADSSATGGMTNRSLAALSPLALILVVVGFGFKLAASPFQFYAPDVYQGTTNANAGVLAVLPKIAGVAGLIRLVVLAMPANSDFAWQLTLVLAVLTMTIGNICALWQRNLRRMMAYSSIAHSGYILIGLAVATGATAVGSTQVAGGVAGMLFYILVYALATIGTFSALAYLGSDRKEVNTTDELAGLGVSHPVIAAALAVFMFSLAGIPPLAGFWGKFTIFGSAIEMAAGNVPPSVSNWFAMLAVVGVLNAAIAAAYYLRIIATMYFQPSVTTPSATGGRGAWASALICAVLVIAAGIMPGRAIGVAARAENQIRSGQPGLVKAGESKLDVALAAPTQ